MKKKIILLLLLCFIKSFLFAQTAKTTRSSVVYELHFLEHTDGCLVLSGNKHYEGIGRRTTSRFGSNEPMHRNDNRYINSEIQYFKNEIKRLSAVSENNQNEIFKNTRIGSWYYVYRITTDNYWYSGNRSVSGYYSATIPLYHYILWRVDVVAK